LTVIEPDAEQPPGSGDTRLKIGQHLRFSRSGEERRRRGLRRSGLSKLNSVRRALERRSAEPRARRRAVRDPLWK
jgi:hypothetical protein